MNADEALKCLNLAKQSINQRDFEKAERFLVKSIKLHETEEAQGLLQRLDQIKKNASQSSTQSSAAKQKKPEAKPAPRPHTPEEAKIASEILSFQCYYEVLGVQKKATETELKKAYKKRALRLHPDKNAAPQAEEAFKRVNDAMMTLGDESKRRLYDQLGSIARFTQKEQHGGGAH